MTKTNIPLFRGKKLNKDEMVIGYYSDVFHMCMGDEKGHFITDISNDKRIQWDIDPSTLAIHFPDMLDSEGTKIFASLSEDGKGGDICDLRRSPMHSFVDEGTACYYDGSFVVRPNKGFIGNYVNLKGTGIQK